MNVIEKFFIQIGVDAKGVDKSIKKVVNDAGGTLKKALSAETLMGARALALAAAATAMYIKSTYAEITALDKLSKELNTSTQRLQMWQGAAEDAGVATDEVGKTWQRMNTLLAETATSGKGALADFVNAGVLPSLQMVDGKLKDTETYILEMADALKNMDAQTRNAVGGKLGIRDNAMLEFLAQGSGAINQQLGHIKELGLYTKEDLEITLEFQKAIKDLRQSFNDMIRTVKTGLLPVYRAVVPVLTKIVQWVSKLIEHWRVFIPAALAVAGVILKSVIPAIGLLSKALLKLLMNPAFLKLALIVGVLAAIGLAIEDILVWMEGGESVIGEFFGPYETFGKRVEDMLKELMANLTELLHVIVDPFMAGIEAVAEWAESVQKSIQAVVDEFTSLPDRIGEGLQQAANRFKEWFTDPISRWIDELLAKIKGFFNIGEQIKSITAGASAMLQRGGGTTNTDNSQHSTSVVQNNTFNGVTGATDAANRLMGNNPIPAADSAY